MSIDFFQINQFTSSSSNELLGRLFEERLSQVKNYLLFVDYAIEAGVNANTMQRVYKELEQMEITETRRGQVFS